MPKERVEYRLWREELENRFPGRAYITKRELRELRGLSKSAFNKRYKLPPGNTVSVITAARVLSGT